MISRERKTRNNLLGFVAFSSQILWHNEPNEKNSASSHPSFGWSISLLPLWRFFLGVEFILVFFVCLFLDIFRGRKFFVFLEFSFNSFL